MVKAEEIPCPRTTTIPGGGFTGLEAQLLQLQDKFFNIIGHSDDKIREKHPFLAFGKAVH